jgi:hypothetical protein
VNEKAATDVFEKDCMIRLGTCVAPVGTAKQGAPVLTVQLVLPGGSHKEETLRFGEMKRIPLAENEIAKAVLTPAKGFDVGAGRGFRYEAVLRGGTTGLIFDGRGRPLELPADHAVRVQKLTDWGNAIEMY